MKYKRGISLTLTAALLLSMLPQIVLPKAAAANIPEREIDSSTYAALGLSLNAEDTGASLTAPYSKEHVSQAFTASEVYVAASGSQASKYLIRDGFDKMETNNRDSAVYDGDNKSNVQGNLAVRIAAMRSMATVCPLISMATPMPASSALIPQM